MAMTVNDGRGEVAVGHNMGGVFILFGEGLSWHMSQGEALALAKALEAESEKLCEDVGCNLATATTDGAGPRHGDGRLARHG